MNLVILAVQKQPHAEDYATHSCVTILATCYVKFGASLACECHGCIKLEIDVIMSDFDLGSDESNYIGELKFLVMCRDHWLLLAVGICTDPMQ